MKRKILLSRFSAAIICIGLLVSVAAFVWLPQTEVTTNIRTFTGRVAYVEGGDTLYLQQPLNAPSPVGDTVIVRLLGIDAPETFTVDGHPLGNQIVHGEASRDFLRKLLPVGTEITVVLDIREVDGLGRVLGFVYKDTLDGDTLLVNRELLRQGHAVTLVIWPNTYSRFIDFRSALLEAKTTGRGMWNPANPIQELPFEYRARVFERPFDRYVGDYFTKTVVRPADHRRVPVENQVQFFTREDAIKTGYRPARIEVARVERQTGIPLGQNETGINRWPIPCALTKVRRL